MKDITKYNREYKRKWRLKHKDYDYRWRNKETSGWKARTDYLYTKNICSFCKKESPFMIKHSGDDSRQYYCCRSCNTSRAREYRKSPRGKKAIRLAVYKSIKNNPEKQKARQVVYRNKLSGRLIRLPCRVCGNKESEAHHADYSRPLDVDWLCRTCHSNTHRYMC